MFEQYHTLSVPALITNPPIQEVFEGRWADYDAINTIVGASNRVVCIRGYKGIGKSALLRSYFKMAASDYQHMAFFDDEVNVEQLNLHDLPNTEIFPFLTQLSGKKLVCIDNFTGDLHTYVPLLQNGWKMVIASSRDIPDTIPYELQEVSLDDAIRIFSVYNGLDPDSLSIYEMEVAGDIASRLLHHPAALELVGRNAGKVGWSLQDVNLALKTNDLKIPRLADISTLLTPERVANLFERLRIIFPS